MIKPWPKLQSSAVGDFRIFQIRSERKQSPRTGQAHDFYVIDCVNWVNVVALTREGSLVLVEQYRHGSNTVELEIPGGMIDATDASPAAAGARELREETGYAGNSPMVIGEVFPNPAIMNNTCYTVLVKDCVLQHPPALDDGEDLITRLVPVAEVPRLVAGGQIRHSLVVAALHHFELWSRAR
jgi:8-oxo-dGTP pyrophosphatase MutT (NUDIX family)